MGALLPLLAAARVPDPTAPAPRTFASSQNISLVWRHHFNKLDICLCLPGDHVHGNGRGRRHDGILPLARRHLRPARWGRPQIRSVGRNPKKLCGNVEAGDVNFFVELGKGRPPLEPVCRSVMVFFFIRGLKGLKLTLQDTRDTASTVTTAGPTTVSQPFKLSLLAINRFKTFKSNSDQCKR